MNKRKELSATASIDQPCSRLDIIKEWLNENYVVRVNLLDRSKVSLSPTDDILLHAFADELPVSQKILKMLLSSPNQMQAFNPVSDYFESLRGKYKGPSQIDLLSSSLHVLEGTAERAGRILRKWIVATALLASDRMM